MDFSKHFQMDFWTLSPIIFPPPLAYFIYDVPFSLSRFSASERERREREKKKKKKKKKRKKREREREKKRECKREGERGGRGGYGML